MERTVRPSASLRRGMIAGAGVTVAAAVALGVGSNLAIDGLHADLGVAVAGYRELRQLYDVGLYAARARQAATATPPDRATAAAAVRAAADALQHNDGDGPPGHWLDESARDRCAALLATASARSPDPASLDVLFAQLAETSEAVRAAVRQTQVVADRKRAAALWVNTALATAVAVAAAVVGARQYRRVMRPLGRLGAGVRAFAGGDFDRRLPAAGDREFAALAGDFNRMADELQRLYNDLERRVRDQSRDLARSERLASVGYLAAGVAHEINNPLGIIAGHAERAARQLDRDPADLAPVRRALAVVADEAFRCKAITDQLLSLARPPAADRAAISLAQLVRDVVATVAGLGTVGRRRLVVEAADDDLAVVVRAGEIKQVVLNLIVNALEAVPADDGRVGVAVARTGVEVELRVVDNGRGMTPAVLDRVFEPFFTDKRSVAAPLRGGTGLGLSIAHAIVAAHGGRLTAASDGPGAGSTFAVRLPAAST